VRHKDGALGRVEISFCREVIQEKETRRKMSLSTREGATERNSKGFKEVDRIVVVGVRELCDFGGSAEKEGNQLTTM